MSATPNVVLTLRLPEAMHVALARLAGREGTSMNHEVQVAIRAHLDADKQRRAK